MSSIQSICVLRLSAIGDVCHAVAVVQAIQRYYPSAEITWVIGRVEAALLRNVPGIKFVIFDKKEGIRAYQKLREQLPHTFDVLLHMQVALRANLAAACIKAKRKIGFPRHLSKELHSLVVSERAPVSARPHVLDGFAGFASALGVPEFTPTWNIPLAESDQAWANAHLPSDRPLFVVSPAASKAERNWLPEGYAAVIDYAEAQGFQAVLCGGPTDHERALAADIALLCRRRPPLNLVGQTSLPQLLAVLNRAAIVLSPDSGPAHMATTQNTPVIGLYAHSNPARTGPYYSRDHVVEVYHQVLHEQTGRTADQLPWGKRVKGADLMMRIRVEQVIDVFDRMRREQQL